MPINEEAFARCTNLSNEAYLCLAYNLASYADLDQHLTLEDAFNMLEFYRVSTHNNALLEELRNELANR